MPTWTVQPQVSHIAVMDLMDQKAATSSNFGRRFLLAVACVTVPNHARDKGDQRVPSVTNG